MPLVIATAALLVLTAAPSGDVPLLTDKDVASLSAEDLRLKRNEVFARHGHRFKARDLDRHFSDQPWYEPSTDDASGLLTPNEKANVELLKKAEKAARERDLKALPDDVRKFWLGFRKAVASGECGRIAAFTRFPFENNVDTGDTHKVRRADFLTSCGAFFDDVPSDTIAREVPHAESKDFFRLWVPVYEPGRNVGYCYVFQRGADGTLQLTGYWVAAG